VYHVMLNLYTSLFGVFLEGVGDPVVAEILVAELRHRLDFVAVFLGLVGLTTLIVLLAAPLGF
jgi:hypothetical protein